MQCVIPNTASDEQFHQYKINEEHGCCSFDTLCVQVSIIVPLAFESFCFLPHDILPGINISITAVQSVLWLCDRIKPFHVTFLLCVSINAQYLRTDTVALLFK